MNAVDALLELDDAAFWRTWASLSPQEHIELPDDVRAAAARRFREMREQRAAVGEYQFEPHVAPITVEAASAGYRKGAARPPITIEGETATTAGNPAAIIDDEAENQASARPAPVTTAENHAAITDQAPVIEVNRGNSDNRSESARLSDLQKRILGLAFTMRQNGYAKVDFSTPLGIYVLYGIAPDLAFDGKRFNRTRAVASAQAAISRAVARLVERELMIHKSPQAYAYGYLLTDSGMEIGRRNAVKVPEIEACARFFDMAGLFRWDRAGDGSWVAMDWMTGKAGGYQWELVHLDLALLRRTRMRT